MIRHLAALLLLALPETAPAGLRAVYERRMGQSPEIRIADSGDVAATLSGGRRLIVRRGEAYVIEERLTGPIVMRVADLEALAAERRKKRAAAGGRTVDLALAFPPMGRVTVVGREGMGFGKPYQNEGPPFVFSKDAALAPLGPTMHRVIALEILLTGLEQDEWPEMSVEDEQAFDVLFKHGAPLKLDDMELRRVERIEDDPSAFALPAKPETAAALRARLAAEKGEDKPPPPAGAFIARAVYSAGRIWLVFANGALRSISEGGDRLVPHPLPGKIADMCAGPAGPVAVTGELAAGDGWTLHRWRGGEWQRDRMVARAGDTLVALPCSGGEEVLLTGNRVISLSGGAQRVLVLAKPFEPPFVQTVVHTTTTALFVGLNSGEWGGGLRRIDRRTGAAVVIERKDGDGCDGPLNTNCDPVHGLATIPWKPSCVAAAVGLIHMAAHGRIVEICGGRVEQLFTQASDRLTRDPDKLAAAAKGGYHSVAFFGLASTADSLLGAGHDGLYRIDASGKATYRPWPRFRRVGDVLVSFDHPEAVLVMTSINRRASVSGAAPLMAVR